MLTMTVLLAALAPAAGPPCGHPVNLDNRSAVGDWDVKWEGWRGTYSLGADGSSWGQSEGSTCAWKGSWRLDLNGSLWVTERMVFAGRDGWAGEEQTWRLDYEYLPGDDNLSGQACYRVVVETAEGMFPGDGTPISVTIRKR